MSFKNGFILLILYLSLAPTVLGDEKHSTESAAINPFSLRLGLAAVFGHLGSVPSLGYQPEIGIQYAASRWQAALAYQFFSDHHRAVMSDRDYRRQLNGVNLVLTYPLGRLCPFISAGISRGRFHIQDDDGNLTTTKNVWHIGAGVGYTIFTLQFRYCGPEVVLSRDASAGTIPLRTEYSMNGDFQLLLGVAFTINGRGRIAPR
jgi:hypothetical protein